MMGAVTRVNDHATATMAMLIPRFLEISSTLLEPHETEIKQTGGQERTC